MQEFWLPKTSTVNAWDFSNSAGQVGKPGRYEDPALFTWPSQAFDQFWPDLRMSADADAGRVQNVANPQASQAGGLGGLLGSLSTITDQLVKTVDSVWKNPDTGEIHFGSGAQLGKQFNETVTAGNTWFQQARGMFGIGLPSEDDGMPVPAAGPVANVGGGGLALFVIAAVILWGMSK